MGTQEVGNLDSSIRAAVASRRLLGSCKGLLAQLGETYLHFRCTVAELRRRLRAPAVVEAMAMVAYVEGTTPPEEPILHWPIRGLLRNWHRDVQPEEYDVLESVGVVTFEDLLDWSPEELIVLDGFGPSGLRAVERALDGSGLTLARPECGPASDSAIYGLPYASLLRYPSASLLEALDREEIETVADLLDWTADELLALDGVGPKALNCVVEGLRHFGLALAEPAPAAGFTFRAA
jgi:hypothetical protein